MIIREIQLRNYQYKSRKGLSEKLARRYFENQGYEIFRGFAIHRHLSLNYHKFESVKRKHDRLERILIKKLGLLLYILRTEINSGIPDFFLHKNQEDMLFAEIKLEHEQIKPNQLKCMQTLESYGFRIMVIRIKTKIFRPETHLHLLSRDRQIRIKQEKLKKRYRRQNPLDTGHPPK